jgi:hypothetical protein
MGFRPLMLLKKEPQKPDPLRGKNHREEFVMFEANDSMWLHYCVAMQ